jgi:hypothetical protein
MLAWFPHMRPTVIESQGIADSHSSHPGCHTGMENQRKRRSIC